MLSEIDIATAKGHCAAKAAADHADNTSLNWTQRAVLLFTEYAKQTPHPFLTEEAREFAEANGLPSPPDARAWGHVSKRCQRAGVIVSVGFGAAKSSNGSPKVLWSFYAERT
jgi:hypothetical protein